MPQVKCKICGKEFYIKPSHQKMGWGKYCSRKCQSKAQLKGKFMLCAECGKKIWRTPKDFKNSKSKKFFCSKSCQTIWRNNFYSGPNHANWAGGNSIYRKILIQHSAKLICAKCGEKDKRVIIAHHRDGNRKNNDVKNLVWLCLNCHCLAHNYNESVD